MLIIKRKTDEVITIEPSPGLDTSQTVNDLFRGGAIEITLLEVGRNQVKFAINAPEQLKIWRGTSPTAKNVEVAESLDPA